MKKLILNLNYHYVEQVFKNMFFFYFHGASSSTTFRFKDFLFGESSTLFDETFSLYLSSGLSLEKNREGWCSKLLIKEVFALSDGVYILVMICGRNGNSITFPGFLCSAFMTPLFLTYLGSFSFSSFFLFSLKMFCRSPAFFLPLRKATVDFLLGGKVLLFLYW